MPRALRPLVPGAPANAEDNGGRTVRSLRSANLVFAPFNAVYANDACGDGDGERQNGAGPKDRSL